VCSQAENSRTGKPIPQREVAAFEERDAEREEELSVVRLRNIALRNQLSKLEGQLRAREELADGLHLIDFEQLKIENATFNEKIEEREEELLKLRHKISKTVIIVSHAKEKLQFTMAANADLRIELAELETEVTRGRDTLNKIKQERDALRSDNLAIRKNGSRISTEELAKDFELGKDSLAGMRTVFADLKARHTDLTERIARLEQANGAARMNHTVGLNRTGGGFH
jgi:chromosome segregation ATPase